MKKPRRRFAADQKATIVKRHLVDKVPISDPCVWELVQDGAELCEQASRQGIAGPEVRRRRVGLLATDGCQRPLFPRPCRQ